MVEVWGDMAGLQSVRDAFESDEPAIGTTLKSVSPNIAEALGKTPLDFIFVDRQHGSPVYEGLEHVVRAADINDLPVVVRVPTNDMSRITYLLDIGVAGIMLPQIEDTETVVEAGTHTRFKDGRSIATTSRAADFGAQSSERYVEYVDEDVALLPQLESETGVGIAEDVAGLDETTAVAIGPGDLSVSLDASPGDPVVESAIDDVFAAADRAGTGAGIFVGDPAGIEKYRDDAAFIIYNSDVVLLMDHFDDVLSE